MLKLVYSLGIRFPKTIIILALVLTGALGSQLNKLYWETDARVYLPKGHEAILYDEKVDDTFGVKSQVIIGIVNDKDGIFNKDTLARVKRVADKVSALEGVINLRKGDVVSIATSSLFRGDEASIGSVFLMSEVPQTEDEIEALKKRIYDNADLFVGNIVSADGSATMIRAKLKEGIANRYQTYFQIKGILAAESGQGWGGAWGGGSSNWSGKKDWGGDSANWGGGTKETTKSDEKNSDLTQTAPSGNSEQQAEATKESNDTFYLAGRPVIEVSSGLFAMEDIKIMVPMIIAVMGLVLFAIFRTLRGTFLPITVMACAIIWTLGLMAALNIPMYTISTMLPVILVAVGIGDAVHLLGAYYDEVLPNPQRSSKEIVSSTMDKLGMPLITTSVTTAIGFLALIFAEMPPFKVFGIFAMLGILFSWLVTVTLIPALLTVMQPKIGSYLARKRAMRVYQEQSRLAWVLTRTGDWINKNRGLGIVIALVLIVGALLGTSRLYVDSSWMSDFNEESEVAKSTDMLNERFSGTTFLNVVIESDQKDRFKDPILLGKIGKLQEFAATLPKVGDSLSLVDYVKNMNKNLHAGDLAYNVLPQTQKQIAEYLYLFSVSGTPELLDQVVDFDYKQGLVSIAIQTDHTKDLKVIIDEVKNFVDKEFQGLGVKVNYAGSANNSYVWADLLIGSQTSAIVLSKIGILILAAIIFMSFVAGIYVIIPVTFSTLIVAGFAGLLGIPLDVSTALAAGIAIGVGVDYAVHYVFRYRAERRLGNNHETATAATQRSAGRTIVLNAFVVTVGFAVLFTSQ
ncbi:MAG: MMPL family transporter, partial [Gammaproteobacteria bacterium]|nr:MMPL family transporter [Gammaproteobacteria bacterium]